MTKEIKTFNQKIGIESENLYDLNSFYYSPDGRVLEGDADVFNGIGKKGEEKHDDKKQKGGDKNGS